MSTLVVDHTLTTALPIVSLLEHLHFHVTVADTFARANARLAEHAPALLVTELRLGEYNGLQLVFRGKERRPAMAALVLSNVPDCVLQADAEAMGATFLITPVDAMEFSAAAIRTLVRSTSASRSLEPIRPPYERRISERRVLAADVDHDRRRQPRRGDVASWMAKLADVIEAKP